MYIKYKSNKVDMTNCDSFHSSYLIMGCQPGLTLCLSLSPGIWSDLVLNDHILYNKPNNDDKTHMGSSSLFTKRMSKLLVRD